MIDREIEGVLLTGGRSSRMGTDKASLEVLGSSLASRIAAEMALAVTQITVIGRVPLEGRLFLKDAEEFLGPRAALARFQPSLPFVFVAACDIPLFRSEIIDFLKEHIGQSDSAICEVDGRLQPLCALYRKSSFDFLANGSATERRIFEWIDRLNVRVVKEEELLVRGIDPRCTKGVNTAEELHHLIRSTGPFKTSGE